MSMKRSGSEVGLIDLTNTPQKKKKTRVPPHGERGDDEDDDTAATLGRGKRAESDKNHDNTVDVDASASESGESDDAEEDDSSTSDDDNDDTEEQDDSVDDEDEILVTTLDYKEYVEENPNITKIPSPSPSLLAMSYGSAVPVLVEEVAIPRAKILFERLVDDGFVKDIFGPFSHEITRSERRRENDQTSKTSIVYLVTKKGAKGSRKVKKAGSSKNGKNRKAKSKSKGIILEADDESMHEIFNLDLLTEEADRYVQELWYEMVEAAINHPECPPPLRHVLQTYTKRGGAGIGFAKNGILQYVELGAKIFFGAPNLDFEFFMCDAGMHEGRQQVVLRDWDQIKPILEEVYGDEAQGRIINVKHGSSWPPNVSKILKNGQPRLFSTQVAMESIAGHPVDILQTNMTRDPPKKKDGNGYTVQGGYSPEQLRNALETFDAKIDGLQDYDFYDLDSCTFIFPSGSLRHLVRRGFKIRCILWDDEVVLLVHPSRKVIIWLHLPYCLAAPGIKRRMASIVKRNLTIQLTTMAVAWCQGTLSTRGQMNCSFHDATLAAFSYEHAIVAAHMYEMHAAACQRDVMTPASTFALIQNDLPRVEGTGVEGTGVGVYIPVARNLRKARYNSQASKKKNRAFVIDNLCIQRALNVARRLKRMKDAKDAVKKITSILATADVKKGAIDQRWRSFFESFVPESKLLAAIKKNLPKKKNKGNPRAKGKTKEEKAVYDSEIRQMKELQVGEEFWVKLKPSDLGPPASPEKGDLEVFANVLYEGAKTHFDQTIKGPLSIRKILTDPSRHNSPAVKSKNGGFVKCELFVKRPELMDG